MTTTPHNSDVELSSLSAEEQQQVAWTWLDRARAEEVAVLRFGRLLTELRACGTHPKVLEFAEQSIAQEGEHAVLCLEVAREYGATEALIADSKDAAPLAPPSLSRQDALLFEMVAYCCLTESMNAALLLEVAQRASEPRIRRTAQKILKDEVHHSQMGWAHLSWCRAQGLGDFLPQTLAFMLDQTGAEEFHQRAPRPPESERLIAHGELPFSDRLALFDRMVREVFLPGIEHAGLNPQAGYAWMDKHFAR